jgi:hypothetical protein
MSRTISPSSGRPYGVARVCRIWQAARATLYRHHAPARAEPSRRPGPAGPMPDAALVEHIRAVISASPFHGEGYRKVWARLHFAGVRTSKHRTAWREGEVRPTSKPKEGAKRGRRRPDPFVTVTAQIREWFEAEPWRTSRELLAAPGRAAWSVCGWASADLAAATEGVAVRRGSQAGIWRRRCRQELGC